MWFENCTNASGTPADFSSVKDPAVLVQIGVVVCVPVVVVVLAVELPAGTAVLPA